MVNKYKLIGNLISLFALYNLVAMQNTHLLFSNLTGWHKPKRTIRVRLCSTTKIQI